MNTVAMNKVFSDSQKLYQSIAHKGTCKNENPEGHFPKM